MKSPTCTCGSHLMPRWHYVLSEGNNKCRYCNYWWIMITSLEMVLLALLLLPFVLSSIVTSHDALECKVCGSEIGDKPMFNKKVHLGIKLAF